MPEIIIDATAPDNPTVLPVPAGLIDASALAAMVTGIAGGYAADAHTQAAISTAQAGIATGAASTATVQAGNATAQAGNAAAAAASALVSQQSAAAAAAVSGRPYPPIFAGQLPQGITSIAIGGAAITGATPGTYPLTFTGGSYVGIVASLVVDTATSAHIVFGTTAEGRPAYGLNIGGGTTLPTIANPAGANLPSGTTLTPVAGTLITAEIQTYWVQSADGLTISLYGNHAGVATPAGIGTGGTFFGGTQLKMPSGVVVSSAYSARGGYIAGFISASGYMLAGFSATDGRLILGVGGDIVGRISALEVATSVNNTKPRSNVLTALLTPSGMMPWSVDAKDGTFRANGIAVAAALSALSAQITALQTSAGAPDLPTDSIAAWGDSLTAPGSSGNWPSTLAANLGVPVYNGGIGGQGSRQIAARQGGSPARVTLTGNAIPAGSTSPITATVNGQTSTLGGWAPTSASGTINGSLAGVAGALTQSSSSPPTFTFTPAAAPASTVSVPAGTPFIPTDGAAQKVNILIVGSGRNSFKSGTSDFLSPTQIIAAIRSMIDYQYARVKRAIVWGIPPFPGETTGSADRNTLDAVNAAIQAAFPAHWLDIPAYLRTTAPTTIGTVTVNDPFTVNGLTPTSTDLSDIASGLIPTQLRVSSTDGHFNSYAGAAVAYRMQIEMQLRGWR